MRQHAARLHATAGRLLRDGALAEEVAQTAFIRLARIPAERWKADPAPLLYRIVLNLCRDELRRQRRARRLVPLESLPEEPVALGETAEDALDAESDRQSIARALSTLPLSSREIIHLRFDAALSYDEIGLTLGLPAGTVASRLHRALRRLGEALAPSTTSRAS